MSKGFTNAHTLSYKNILEGDGFGLNEAYPALKLVEEIRRLSNA